VFQKERYESITFTILRVGSGKWITISLFSSGYVHRLQVCEFSLMTARRNRIYVN